MNDEYLENNPEQTWFQNIYILQNMLPALLIKRTRRLTYYERVSAVSQRRRSQHYTNHLLEPHLNMLAHAGVHEIKTPYKSNKFLEERL